MSSISTLLNSVKIYSASIFIPFWSIQKHLHLPGPGLFTHCHQLFTLWNFKGWILRCFSRIFSSLVSWPFFDYWHSRKDCGLEQRTPKNTCPNDWENVLSDDQYGPSPWPPQHGLSYKHLGNPWGYSKTVQEASTKRTHFRPWWTCSPCSMQPV